MTFSSQLSALSFQLIAHSQLIADSFYLPPSPTIFSF